MTNVADMVEYYYKTAGITPDVSTCMGLVIEEFFEWKDETEFEDCRTKLDGELKELADLIYVVYGYAQSRGWNLNEAVYRVHCNNLERQRQDDGTILRNEAGKIIKNPKAPKVNLEDLV